MVAAVLALFCALIPPDTQETRSERYLTRFGERYLAGVDVVAEVEVASTRELGMAVDVVTLVPKRFLVPKGIKITKKTRPLTVLSNRGHYVKGTRFLVFLERYGTGRRGSGRGGSNKFDFNRRFVTRQRLAFLDKDYKEKLRLIEGYIAIERIAKIEDRAQALKVLLLDNIGDPSDWVRWNTLDELEKLVKERAALFEMADADRLDAVGKMDFPETFKKSLAAVRAAILEKLDDEKKK
jgi:hypothetical protein